MGGELASLPVPVLAAVKLEDGQVVVRVVANNDMEPDSIFPRTRRCEYTAYRAAAVFARRVNLFIASGIYRLMRRWRVLIRPTKAYPLRLPNIQIDRQKVAHTTAEHEAVPDGMVVWNAFADVENHPERINHAAYRQ